MARGRHRWSKRCVLIQDPVYLANRQNLHYRWIGWMSPRRRSEALRQALRDLRSM